MELGFMTRESAWGRVDPLADEASDMSPYVNTANNPIRFIDPDGLFPIDPNFRNNFPLLTKIYWK